MGFGPTHNRHAHNGLRQQIDTAARQGATPTAIDNAFQRMPEGSRDLAAHLYLAQAVRAKTTPPTRQTEPAA